MKDDPAHADMTREQLETVVLDFKPVLEIVEEIQKRADKAEAYLDV